MGRLVEIQRGEDAPAAVRLRAGDVLSVGASGARVRAGEGVISLLGAFLPAVCGGGGDVIAPEGAPSIVLFLARSSGKATVEIVIGDPWSTTTWKAIDVTVD